MMRSLEWLIVVSVLGDDGHHIEVFRRRRSGRSFPFQALCSPRVLRRDRAVAYRPEEIDQGNRVADGKDRSTCRSTDVEYLEFGRIDRIAARHAKIAQHKLREEREVKAQENQGRSDARPHVRIQAARYLRPPEVNATQVSHDGAAYHDVVEVR